jgi:hypothetical protein
VTSPTAQRPARPAGRRRHRTDATLAPVTRSRGTRRTNRVLLSLLGAILVAAGAAGLAAGLGAFGTATRHRAVLTPDVSSWGDRYAWLWPVVAVVAALIGLAALRWLAIQLRSDVLREVPLERDVRHGETTLSARAVTTALSQEIDSYFGVAAASARLRGTPYRSDLVIRATLDGRADLPDVRRRIETEAIAHARQALQRPDLPVRLELHQARNPRRGLR